MTHCTETFRFVVVAVKLYHYIVYSLDFLISRGCGSCLESSLKHGVLSPPSKMNKRRWNILLKWLNPQGGAATLSEEGGWDVAVGLPWLC